MQCVPQNAARDGPPLDLSKARNAPWGVVFVPHWDGTVIVDDRHPDSELPTFQSFLGHCEAWLKRTTGSSLAIPSWYMVVRHLRSQVLLLLTGYPSHPSSRCLAPRQSPLKAQLINRRGLAPMDYNPDLEVAVGARPGYEGTECVALVLSPDGRLFLVFLEHKHAQYAGIDRIVVEYHRLSITSVKL